MTKLTLKLACKACKYAYLTSVGGGGLPSLLKSPFRAFLFAFLIMSISIPTWATETCAGGAGILFTGKDGITQYCLSNKTMNWWSAHAWCDALGMKLFNISTECNKVNIVDINCGQLISRPRGCEVWTQNVPSTDAAYVIYMGSDFVPRTSKRSGNKNVLCQF